MHFNFYYIECPLENAGQTEYHFHIILKTNSFGF